MPVKIEAYLCEHCRKVIRKTKRGIINHEKNRCFANPARRTCRNCRYDKERDFDNDYCPKMKDSRPRVFCREWSPNAATVELLTKK